MDRHSDKIPETVKKLAASSRELASAYELLHEQVKSGKVLDTDAISEAIDTTAAIHRETRALFNVVQDVTYMKEDTRFDIERAREVGNMRPARE